MLSLRLRLMNAAVVRSGESNKKGFPLKPCLLFCQKKSFLKRPFVDLPGADTSISLPFSVLIMQYSRSSWKKKNESNDPLHTFCSHDALLLDVAWYRVAQDQE